MRLLLLALVAAWGFEEGSGTTALDASGRGHVGTLEGPTRVAGKFGQAILCDGVDDQVRVADAPDLVFTNQFSLSAWVYPTARVNRWADGIMKGSDEYYLEPESPSGVPAGGWGGATDLFGPTPLPLNAWTHLAMTYNGAELRMYVNGSFVTSVARSGTLGRRAGYLGLCGNHAAWPNQHWPGRLDEVRIYDHAQTQAEIQADLASPTVGIVPSPTSVAFAYTTGGPLPNPATITVTVAGSGRWSTMDTSSFYDASAACYDTSTCASGSSTTLTPSPGMASLPAGTHRSDLTLRSSGLPDVVVPVSVVVGAGTSPIRLRWQQPQDGSPSEFRAYTSVQDRVGGTRVWSGMPTPDAQGIYVADVPIDLSSPVYVWLTAANAQGESGPSNSRILSQTPALHKPGRPKVR